MRFAVLAFAAGVLALPLAAHADLLGDTISAAYAYPDAFTIFAPLGTFTAPGGGSVPDGLGGTLGTYQFNATQIVFTAVEDETFQVSAFNGFEFADLSKDPMITDLTLDPASTIMGNPVAFSSNSVQIDLSGLVVNAGDQLIYDLSFGSTPPSTVTPEPSSIALLGTGLLGIAGTLRRRLVKA